MGRTLHHHGPATHWTYESQLGRIVPSPKGLTPAMWKQTATLCPLEWPSNYSLLRLWHVESFLKRNSILFPHATFLSVCLRLFFGQTKETTTKQETKTHEHLKKGNTCSTYNVLRFHSRVGRAGRPKNSDKRLVPPNTWCLPPCLSLPIPEPEMPEMRWLCPICWMKKAVHLPFVNCQLCNLFISETSSFEFPFFSAMRLFDFRRLSLHHMWRGVGFTRVHVHVRLQFSILQHIRRHSRMRTCDTFGS